MTPDQKREVLAALEEDDAWIARHPGILPAQGTRDPAAQLGTVLNAMGSDFFDDIRAAQGSGRIFLSEDQVLRAVAAAEFLVPSTWLQPVLMRGVDNRQDHALAICHGIVGIG
jgi:hypothetical protein